MKRIDDKIKQAYKNAVKCYRKGQSKKYFYWVKQMSKWKNKRNAQS
jgi:hypothetical protein